MAYSSDAIKRSANITARHVPIDLPSKCVLYPDIDPSNVYVRPFALPELDKIRVAQQTGKLRAMVQAIDNTLNINAFDLTIGDFNRIMYWHRISSYPKRPLSIGWSCNDESHIALASKAVKSDVQLEEGEVYPDDLANQTEEEEDEILHARATLKNTFLLSKNSLKVTSVTVENVNKAMELMKEFALLSEDKDDKGNTIDGSGLFLNIPRMSDIIEQTEVQMLKMSKSKKFISTDTADPEDVSEYLEILSELDKNPVLTELATYLSRVHGLTLEDRIKYLAKRVDDSIENANLYSVGDDMYHHAMELNYLLDHGVREVVETKCGGCGNKASLDLPFDYARFFP